MTKRDEVTARLRDELEAALRRIDRLEKTLAFDGVANGVPIIGFRYGALSPRRQGENDQ
jgi:hypothetical protein